MTSKSSYNDVIPSGYVLVKSSDMTTPASRPSERPESSPGGLLEEKKSLPLARPRLLRQRGRQGGRSTASKPIRQTLTVSNTTVSSAATALAVSIGLNPSTSADFAALASLFDEVRVLGSKIHYRLDTSAVSAVQISGVLAYDPIESTALASLANALTYPHHALFAIAAGPTAKSAGPAPTTSTGYWSLAAKVYPDSARNTASTAITNGWMSTSDASDIWGYWKFLVEPASAAVTVTATYHIELLCEFRSRQ